jgi:hypothetical protein
VKRDLRLGYRLRRHDAGSFLKDVIVAGRLTAIGPDGRCHRYGEQEIPGIEKGRRSREPPFHHGLKTTELKI